MAMRRKSNTAEVLPPEQEETLRSVQQPATKPQPANDTGSGNGNMQSSAQPRSERPALTDTAQQNSTQPIAQNRNSADLENRIRQRAYEIYEARGRQDGQADQDWLLAEEEITGITGGG